MKQSVIMVVLLGGVLLVVVVVTLVRELQDGIIGTLKPLFGDRDRQSAVDEGLAYDDEMMAIHEEGEFAYTAEQVETWLDELQPLVEELAGRRFRIAPVVRVVDRAQLAEALARNILARWRRHMPQIEDSELAEVARWEAEITAAHVLGLYDEDERVVYLTPTNLDSVGRLADVDQRHIEPIAKMVTAHELTHALQDQHVGLNTVRWKLTDGPHLEAFSATVEGQAAFIADLVGERLGLDEARLEVARLLSAGALGEEDSVYARVAQLQFQQRYLGGRDFIRYHFDRGGIDRVWEILASPPRRMSTIVNPAAYGRPARGPGDYASVLAGLETYFGNEWWTVTNETGYFDHPVPDHHTISPENLLDFATFVEDIQVLKIQERDTATGGEIRLFALADSDFTKRLAEIRESWLRRAVHNRQRSTVAKVRDVVIDDFSGIEAAVARVVSYRQALHDGADRSYHYKTVIIGRDNVLVEVAARLMELPDESIIELAEELFKRCRELEAASGAGAARVERRGPGKSGAPRR